MGGFVYLVKGLFNLKLKIIPETYATDASGRKYRTRKDYEAGRFQSMGRNAAQRARINRRVGGRVV